MKDVHSYPKNIVYEWARTLFGPHSTDNNLQKFARPIGAGITFSAMELLPWSMPLQNIKAAMQVDPRERRTMIGATLTIIQKRGFRGLLNGATSDMLRQSGRQPVRMIGTTQVPGLLQPIIPQSVQDHVPLALPVAVGLTTAVMEVATTLPLEARKTYMTTRGLSTTGSQGFSFFSKSAYRGAAATASRQLVAWPLLFVTNDTLVKAIKKYSPDGQVSYTALLAAAPISSAAFVGGTNMLDVIKTHHQQANDSVLGLHKLSVPKAIVSLHRQAGIRGLFSGVVPSVLQRTPAAFLLLAMPIFIKNEEKRAEQPYTVRQMLTKTKLALLGDDKGGNSPTAEPGSDAPVSLNTISHAGDIPPAALWASKPSCASKKNQSHKVSTPGQSWVIG